MRVWHKMQIKPKNPKNTNAFFSTISLKNRNGNICILSHNFWINQGLDLLSTSKWPSEPQFCERWKYIWRKNSQKWSYNGHLWGTFISNQSLVDGLFLHSRAYSLHNWVKILLDLHSNFASLPPQETVQTLSKFSKI